MSDYDLAVVIIESMEAVARLALMPVPLIIVMILVVAVFSIFKVWLSEKIVIDRPKDRF